MSKFPDSEELLGIAVTYLLEGNERDAALLLIECECESYSHWDEEIPSYSAAITLKGPRRVTNILNDAANPLSHAIHSAFEEVSKAYGHRFYDYEIVAKIQTPSANWREEALAIATGQDVHNQAAMVAAESVRVWNNLRFRSQTEVRVAQELDARGVMFFPNCKARLTTPVGRRNKEPDFLICHKGKWGVLEVDGDLFHPPSRTTEDHDRDRLFKTHGVRHVEHFDANECYKNTKDVVDRFLNLLAES